MGITLSLVKKEDCICPASRGCLGGLGSTETKRVVRKAKHSFKSFILNRGFHQRATSWLPWKGTQPVFLLLESVDSPCHKAHADDWAKNSCHNYKAVLLPEGALGCIMHTRFGNSVLQQSLVIATDWAGEKPVTW